MSTKRREGARIKRDQDGRKLCSCGCGRHPVHPRINWFSQECVDQWKIRNDPKTVSYLVKARDKGVCAICGIDTIAEHARYRKALTDHYEAVVHDRHRVSWISAETIENLTLRDTPKPPEGFPGLSMRWWQADHIVPVVEGGGQCGLENYRTLCIPCHKRVTRELRARLATKRKAEKS